MANIKKSRAELFNRLFTVGNNWENVLYVHTPFCVQKCYYCIYLSKEPEEQAEMDAFYREVLPGQIEQYRPTLEREPFGQVYFGGGTPTIGDAGTLEALYKQIPGFRDIPVKATESSPYTVTDDHIDLFHDYRFSYVSMGVQTLSERILKTQHRVVVDKEKLHHVCRRLDRYGIISNIDLICYLDTGGIEDLVQTREDLETVMSGIRPVSITIHYNYRSNKSYEKREAMVRLLNEMIARYPEYMCVNGLLEKEDIEYDMNHSAEYRLMRDHKDFMFYMLPKIPDTHTYGHNMLALGEYRELKPRYNFFYVYDFMDKYAYLSMLDKLDSFIREFNRGREKMGLPPQRYVGREDFFADEGEKEKFKVIVKQFGLPFHDFNG